MRGAGGCGPDTTHGEAILPPLPIGSSAGYPGRHPLHKRSLRRSRLSGTGGKRGNQSPASCPEDPEEIRLGSV